MTDHVIATAWDMGSLLGRWPGPLAERGMAVNGLATTDQQVFVWRQGRDEVTLTREGDAWRVAYWAQGRLLGPRRCLYERRHKGSKYAAFDVLARVVKASHDEAAGVQAALEAAQCMKRMGIPDAFEGGDA